MVLDDFEISVVGAWMSSVLWLFEVPAEHTPKGTCLSGSSKYGNGPQGRFLSPET